MTRNINIRFAFLITVTSVLFLSPADLRASQDRIVFTAYLEENWDLFMTDPDGASLVQLTHTPYDERCPAFSPDGETIAYTTRDGLYVLSLQAEACKGKRLLECECSFPIWTGNGEKILVASHFSTAEIDDSDLILVDVSDGSYRKVIDQTGIQDYPALSPDGRLLFYTTTLKGPLSKVTEELWALDQQTRIGLQKTLLHANSVYASFSPASSLLAFTSNVHGQDDIWLLDMNAEKPKRLTSSPTREYDPSWSPDGRKLVYVEVRDGRPGLAIIDVTDKTTKVLDPFKGKDTPCENPHWGVNRR